MAGNSKYPESNRETVKIDGTHIIVGIGFLVIFVGAIAPGIAPLLVVPIAIASLIIFLPKLARRIREARLNAPSPESKAAVAGSKFDFQNHCGRVDMQTVGVLDTHPGRVLPHQLTIANDSPGAAFGCIVGFALIWNGFVITVLSNAAGGMTLLAIPFALAGLGLIFLAMRFGCRWFAALLVGRVDVEISDHPVFSGGRFRIHVTQAGPFPLDRVTVCLVCREQATYSAGTSKCTATKDVASLRISEPTSNSNSSGVPIEAEFTPPTDAMHSFDAPNNKIIWTIAIKGRTLASLPFSADYRVTLAPRIVDRELRAASIESA